MKHEDVGGVLKDFNHIAKVTEERSKNLIQKGPHTAKVGSITVEGFPKLRY